jgi:hypothetical protein
VTSVVSISNSDTTFNHPSLYSAEHIITVEGPNQMCIQGATLGGIASQKVVFAMTTKNHEIVGSHIWPLLPQRSPAVIQRAAQGVAGSAYTTTKVYNHAV